MIIKVKVRPNSGRQEIIANEEGYIVYLKSAPEDNKANMELVKLLKKHFGKAVRTKSGFISKNKIVEVADEVKIKSK